MRNYNSGVQLPPPDQCVSDNIILQAEGLFLGRIQRQKKKSLSVDLVKLRKPQTFYIHYSTVMIYGIFFM